MKKKHEEVKKATCYVSLLCYLKITFFSVIIFWGRVFKEIHLFFCLPIYIFVTPKFVHDAKVTRSCAGNT